MQLFPLLLFLMVWQLVTCENKQPTSRSNVPNLENKAVELGDLYDGLTDRLLTPKNFYKPETIENNKKTYPGKKMIFYACMMFYMYSEVFKKCVAFFFSFLRMFYHLHVFSPTQTKKNVPFPCFNLTHLTKNNAPLHVY